MKLKELNYSLVTSQRGIFTKKMNEIKEKSVWKPVSCSDLRYKIDEDGQEKLTVGISYLPPYLCQHPTMEDTINYCNSNPNLQENPMELFQKIAEGRDYEVIESYPLTELAKDDLIERAKVGSRFKEKGFFERNIDSFNDALWSSGQEDEKAKIYMIDGTVFAVPSENYKPLPIDELLDVMETELKGKYKDVKFSNGFYCHEIACADYAIGDKNVVRAYERALNQVFYNPKVILRLVTSNLGFSGANLYPILEYSTSPSSAPIKMMLGASIELPHKGIASIEEFKKNVNKTFTLVETLPENLKKLNDIKIKHPTHCLINVCDKCGVPARYVYDIADQCACIFNGGEATARNIYMLMSKIVLTGKDEREKIKLSEKIGRGIRILLEDSADVDIPKIRWKTLSTIICNEGQIETNTENEDNLEQISFAEVGAAS